ncbi:MAG: carbohydrate kinase family protein [Anaerolineae bacterium]|nr:carbohydrate kinase family protein [Anaerolineae bacterium]
MAEDTEELSYVVVIGAAGIDSKGRADGPLTLGTSTPGLVRVSVGGTGRNVADNLSRLGVDIVLLSAVGDDDSGKQILDSAAEIGIDTDYIIVSNEYHTSAYIALLDEHGNLVMSVDDMKILAAITPQVIEDERDLLEEAAMIVIDSNLSEETIDAIFKMADRYNVPVCADPASAGLARKLMPYLSQIYMITPNVAEARVLADCEIKDEQEAIAAARRLVNAGVKIALITLAEEGVVYATADASGHVPAMATNLIDSTGASDALTATVVFGLLNDIPIDEAVRLGASAAALTLSCSDTVCVDLSLELLYEHLVI